jgi:hypothetical protein
MSFALLRNLLIGMLTAIWLHGTFSCINPFIKNNGIDTSGNDTLPYAWINAGIVSTGENGQHLDVTKYGDTFFTYNNRGELFACTYPELEWSQIMVPGGQGVYCFYCDTVNGLLYISTIEVGVFEYSINNETWRSLLPEYNTWFDSSKLYMDTILSIHMYDITCFNDMIYIMTVQRWGGEYDPVFDVHIRRSMRDTIWEYADSGWDKNNRSIVTITDFFSMDQYLYATTFLNGLWRFDGIKWMGVPGTQENDIINNGGDDTIPGIRPRSVAKHNGDLYVGTKTGTVYKMLPGFQWQKFNQMYIDYGFDTIVNFGPPVTSMFSYNNHLIRGTFYLNDSSSLWHNMTPGFKAIDQTYNNSLPGHVYGMTNIGDTLFAALGNDEGKHSGVYFLDLRTCPWYKKRF